MKKKIKKQYQRIFCVNYFRLTFATETKNNNAMKHQYQSNYKSNVYLDVVDTYQNGHLKCVETTYGKRGSVKTKNVSLWKENLEGQWANYHLVIA